MVLAACFGQLLAGCGQDTPDHLDFALRTLKFVVSSAGSQWRQPPTGGLPDMVCGGPQALAVDCCSPPSPLPPVDCGQYPMTCDPIDNFCALTFQVDLRVDVNLSVDVPAVAAVDGRVFSAVTLESLDTTVTVTGFEPLPIRGANLFLGPRGLASAASPEATLLGAVSLASGIQAVVLAPGAQEMFSSYAREYRTPFAFLLSTRVVVPNGTKPSGELAVSVNGSAKAIY